MNYNLIKTLAKRRDITVEHLAYEIGMSKGGLFSAIRNESLRVRDLEKIAVALRVKPAIFFDDERPKTGEALPENCKSCQVFKEKLEEKEKYINALNKLNASQEKQITTLEKQAENFQKTFDHLTKDDNGNSNGKGNGKSKVS